MEVQKLIDLKAIVQDLEDSVPLFDGKIAAMKSAVQTVIDEAGSELPPSDKIYTQADLDAAVLAAVVPLQAEIANLKETLPAQVNAAVAGFKAELALKYAELQVIETASETGFAELLK